MLRWQAANEELDRKAREKAALSKMRLAEQKEVIAGQLELKAELKRQRDAYVFVCPNYSSHLLVFSKRRGSVNQMLYQILFVICRVVCIGC